MRWSTINFFTAIEQLLASFLRRPILLSIMKSLTAPLVSLQNEILYQMQHDGRTIYLEKVLNEVYGILNYDTQNHEGTKQIYIEDTDELEKLYIHVDAEPEVIFLEDNSDSLDDIFLDSENENTFLYSWIIFVPVAVVYDEITMRALVDSYRFIGKKYIIQTY